MRSTVPAALLALCLANALCLAPAPCRAQAAGVAIERRRLPAPTPEMIAQVQPLIAQGKLLTFEQAADRLAHPHPAPVTLAPTATVPLTPSAIAARARRSFLRIGWFFRAPRGGDDWRITLADGYVLTPDGVCGTAYHVLRPNRQMMREGYLIALDADGKVYPITDVLTGDERMDGALFRLGGASHLVPLGINDQTAPGDAVYLLSDPGWVAGYFSSGVINRFYWDGRKATGDPMLADDVRSLRMDVGVDWAPGSSGGALLDHCGNVVAHVSKISVIPGPYEDRPVAEPGATTGPAGGRVPRSNSGPSTFMVLHEAAPVRGIRLLVDALNHPPTPSPTTAPTTAPTTSAAR